MAKHKNKKKNKGIWLKSVPMSRRDRDVYAVARDPKATDRVMKLMKQAELTNAAKCPVVRNIDELLIAVPTILSTSFPCRDVLKDLMLDLRDYYLDKTTSNEEVSSTSDNVSVEGD